MRFSDLWPSLQPYIAQHPWLAPLLAAGFPIAAVLRGLAALWGSYQEHQREEHDRDLDLYRAIIDQRDAAMRDLGAERRDHAATRRRAEAAEEALANIKCGRSLKE